MKGRLVHRSALSEREKERMFALYARHFVGARRDVFRADLEGKNWAVLLERGQGNRLVGFSTLHLYEARHGGRSVAVACSGDTIVEPSAWSAPGLATHWISAVNRLQRDHAHGPLYWLLLVSGYRTYRFLPTFWRRFHPRFDAPTPRQAAALIDSLASDRFGDLFDPERGVVRFPHPAILRDGLRGIPPERMRDPHVAFFARRNRGHERGDELVCLTRIAASNLTRAGRRVWSAGERACATREAS